MKLRAFTLLEAAVTLVIMAIVAVAAIGSFSTFSRLAKEAERDVILVETLRTGLLYLLTEVRLAGGVGVPPWASAIIEDNCEARGGLPDCKESDRLTIVQGIPTYPGCVVSEDAGGTLKFEEGGAGSCCFFERDFVRQVALLFPDGARFPGDPSDETMQPGVLRSVGDCSFSFFPIIPGDKLPRPLSANASFSRQGRKGAVAVLADVKTFYVEWTAEDRGALTMHVELDGNDSVVGERLTILPIVADFQAALGYTVDGRPFVESASGVGDAWWPGSPDETGIALAADPALRPERTSFVGVSAIAVDTGSPRTVHVQTAWGPPRTMNNLRAIVGVERLALQGN